MLLPQESGGALQAHGLALLKLGQVQVRPDQAERRRVTSQILREVFIHITKSITILPYNSCTPSPSPLAYLFIRNKTPPNLYDSPITHPIYLPLILRHVKTE